MSVEDDWLTLLDAIVGRHLLLWWHLARNETRDGEEHTTKTLMMVVKWVWCGFSYLFLIDIYYFFLPPFFKVFVSKGHFSGSLMTEIFAWIEFLLSDKSVNVNRCVMVLSFNERIRQLAELFDMLILLLFVAERGVLKNLDDDVFFKLSRKQSLPIYLIRINVGTS